MGSEMCIRDSEQRARWAQEDAARANVKTMAREQRKAQRAKEKHELECGR